MSVFLFPFYLKECPVADNVYQKGLDTSELKSSKNPESRVKSGCICPHKQNKSFAFPVLNSLTFIYHSYSF